METVSNLTRFCLHETLVAPQNCSTKLKELTIPVHDTHAVEVLHCRDDLAGVLLGLLFRESLVVADVCHQVTASHHLQDQIIVILCLHHLEANIVT